PQFSVSAERDGYEVSCFVKINGQPVDIARNECKSPLLFFYNNNLYLWNRPEDVALAERFAGGESRFIPKAEWPAQLRDFVLPLTMEYPVDFGRGLVREIREGDPERKLLLQEKGDYLVFQPLYSYKGFETRPGGKDEIVVPDGDKVLIVHRNKEAELQFFRKL